MSEPTKKLFEIKMTAIKTFFVEADSQDEALSLGVIDDEAHSFGCQYEWEFDEADAKEVSEYQAAHIRAMRPRSIAKD